MYSGQSVCNSRMLFCMQESKSLLFIVEGGGLILCECHYQCYDLTHSYCWSWFVTIWLPSNFFCEVFSANLMVIFWIQDTLKALGGQGKRCALSGPCNKKRTLKKHLLISRQLTTYGPIIQSLCMPNPTGETQLPGKP